MTEAILKKKIKENVDNITIGDFISYNNKEWKVVDKEDVPTGIYYELASPTDENEWIYVEEDELYFDWIDDALSEDLI